MKAKYLAMALIGLLENNSPNNASKKFLYFLEKKSLTYFLPSIIHYVKIELEKKQAEGVARIYLAGKHDDQLKNQIKRIAGVKKDAPEDCRIDKELLGGFVVEYNNIIYDGSIKTQLKKLALLLKE